MNIIKNNKNNNTTPQTCIIIICDVGTYIIVPNMISCSRLTYIVYGNNSD